MKLAEALLLRSEMQTKLSKLRQRIAKAAIVQEGDKPQETAEVLVRESLGILDELHTLIERIHRTNHNASFDDGRPLAAVIAERDRLRQHVALLSFAAEAATTAPEQARYSMREIRWVPMLDASKLHTQIDEVSSKLRELNAKLQEANWRITLAE